MERFSEASAEPCLLATSTAMPQHLPMENRNRIARLGPALLGALLLAACGKPDASGDASLATPAETPPPVSAQATATVWDAMIKVLIPQSNAIWELAGNLWNDDGKIEPDRLTPEQWAQLKQAAQAMRDSAAALADTARPIAAPPGVKILNEGTAGALGAAEVQAAIDANPQAFRQAAAGLVAIATDIAVAADTKDGVKMDALSNQLTDVCGACHMQFWTPNQAP